MPLDRLPPAPAPSAPTPQRSSRAASEDAQTFALPEDNRSSSKQAAASASKADKARGSQERETISETPSEQSPDTPASSDAETLQTQPNLGSAHMLNEAAYATQGDAQLVADGTDLASANPDGDTLPSGAVANGEGKSGANAARPDAPSQAQDKSQASTTTPTHPAASDKNAGPATAQPTSASSGQDTDAPEETAVFKPDSTAKTADMTGAGKTHSAESESLTAARGVPTPGQQADPSGASQQPAPEDSKMSKVTSSDAASQASEDTSGIDTQDTPRPVREAESGRPEARPTDAAPSQKDVQVKTDQVQTAGKPVAQEAATAPQQPQSATTASQKTAQTAETSSASALAEQAEADASTQAALRQSEAEARNAVSDRSPSAQNKARHGDKDIAAPSTGAKVQSETASASANQSASEASAAATSRTQQPSAAAATSAPTDPLAWLLQDSLLVSDAPLDVPADSTDADLDLSTVRAEPRIEAARPSQHPQAHAASRFAPTTTQTLAAQITRKFNDGGRVFDIRLDPPELGRVEVRLELGPDNKVSALLSAERADTLSELQRHARDLEKALADAGLELGEDGLSFSLSEDNGAFSGFQNEADGSADGFSARNQFTVEVETDLPGAPLADALYGFAVSQRAGVNLIA